ncbi:hypothetical protein Tco_1493798 [Tanacetum coccineum]
MKTVGVTPVRFCEFKSVLARDRINVSNRAQKESSVLLEPERIKLLLLNHIFYLSHITQIDGERGQREMETMYWLGDKEGDRIAGGEIESKGVRDIVFLHSSHAFMLGAVSEEERWRRGRSVSGRSVQICMGKDGFVGEMVDRVGICSAIVLRIVVIEVDEEVNCREEVGAF